MYDFGSKAVLQAIVKRGGIFQLGKSFWVSFLDEFCFSKFYEEIKAFVFFDQVCTSNNL